MEKIRKVEQPVFAFNLGDEVAHKYSSFRGVIRSRADYLTGCNRYGVHNIKYKNTPDQWLHFDEAELDFIKSKYLKEQNIQKGGVLPDYMNPPKY